MKKDITTMICNLVCAVLLLATIVMMCQPFWTCSGCKTHKEVEKDVSVAEYMWIPKHHTPIAEDMTDYYKEIYGKNYRDAEGRKFKFKANEILPTMLTAFLGSIVGILGGIFLRKKFYVAVAPLVVGVAGIIGFTTCPALMIGKSTQAQLILAIVVAAAGLISLVIGGVLELKSKMKTKKK